MMCVELLLQESLFPSFSSTTTPPPRLREPRTTRLNHKTFHPELTEPGRARSARRLHLARPRPVLRGAPHRGTPDMSPEPLEVQRSAAKASVGRSVRGGSGGDPRVSGQVEILEPHLGVDRKGSLVDCLEHHIYTFCKFLRILSR